MNDATPAIDACTTIDRLNQLLATWLNGSPGKTRTPPPLPGRQPQPSQEELTMNDNTTSSNPITNPNQNEALTMTDKHTNREPKTVRTYRKPSRQRFLAPGEIRALYIALVSPETQDNFRDYILMSLYTGARRSNILSMRWCDINTETKVWTIPADQSKDGAIMRLPLTAPAVEILEQRRAQGTSTLVFASTGKTGHYTAPKRAWEALLKRAGIADCQLHDLRRIAASVMAAQGTNNHVIDKALGHQNPASTAAYAQLPIDQVRDAMEGASKAMRGCGTAAAVMKAPKSILGQN